MALVATEVYARAEALVAAADAIIAKASAGTYVSARAYEADVAALRTDLAGLLPDISTTWGIAGAALHRALRELVARVIELRGGIAEGTETRTETTTTTTSLIELAVEWYDDFTRWSELASLNPDLPHPGFISPDTVLVRYVR